jgi:hypothetical protein
VCAFLDFCSGIVISVKWVPIVLKLERERETGCEETEERAKRNRV